MPHKNKINIDVSLVYRLVNAQFPQWTDLDVKPVEFSGWDNRTFHLGEHMSVRLPSAAEYSSQVEKEHIWLSKLAPLLPLQIPMPLAMGKPAEGYPWHWSVYRWLDGETASYDRITDLCQFATALAEFLNDLQKIDATGGPISGRHNFYRGGLLSTYDAETRESIVALSNYLNTDVVTAIWNEAIDSTWQAPPVWVHGDISVGNLLVEHGVLSAVIDFGCTCIGDPACDLAIAWTFFNGKSREMFRKTLQLDNATWARGRGWALWKALITCVPHSVIDNSEVEKARRVIDEIIDDYERCT